MSADFWAAASAEFLLWCHQYSFFFNCSSVSSFVIICLDWTEWRLNDDQNHSSNLSSCSSLLLTVQDLLCWIWDSWWMIILCLFKWQCLMKWEAADQSHWQCKAACLSCYVWWNTANYFRLNNENWSFSIKHTHLIF